MREIDKFSLRDLKVLAYDCFKQIKRLQYEGQIIEDRIAKMEKTEKDLGSNIAKGARHDSDKQSNT